MFLCLLRSRPEWGPGGIIFIPQASYATQGTLAAQVVRGPLIRTSPSCLRVCGGLRPQTLRGPIGREVTLPMSKSRAGQRLGLGQRLQNWGFFNGSDMLALRD